MSAYDEVKKAIEAEKNGPPGNRRQMIPCAFCKNGGNGSKVCGVGWAEKRYSRFKGCFAGELLEEKP